jgi:hypothetical protein
MGIVTGIVSKPMSMSFLINDIYKSSYEFLPLCKRIHGDSSTKAVMSFYLCAKESMEIDRRI